MKKEEKENLLIFNLLLDQFWTWSYGRVWVSSTESLLLEGLFEFGFECPYCLLEPEYEANKYIREPNSKLLSLQL